jgi:hypothetical protein
VGNPVDFSADGRTTRWAQGGSRLGWGRELLSAGLGAAVCARGGQLDDRLPLPVVVVALRK